MNTLFNFKHDARSEGASIFRQKKKFGFFVYPTTHPMLLVIFYLCLVIGYIKRPKKPNFFFCRFSWYDAPYDRASHFFSFVFTDEVVPNKSRIEWVGRCATFVFMMTFGVYIEHFIAKRSEQFTPISKLYMSFSHRFLYRMMKEKYYVVDPFKHIFYEK